jgi:peptidoglycan hydrolase-like protein with peptidoglycan-binding domain
MKTFRTVALSAALIAMTLGPALADEAKPAAGAAPSAKTESKAKATTTSSTKHTTWSKDQYKEAQEALAKGGYYKGTVNGTWNKASSEALKSWQKANKMPANGHLSEETLAKLKTG